MTWGAVGVSAVALGSAVISSNAANSAAKGQQGAADRATALTQQQFDTTRADTAPYRSVGTGAVTTLNRLVGTSRAPSVATSDKIARNDFDAQAYLDANPDVAADVSNYAQDPYRHYLDHGMSEGRQGYQFGQVQQPDENAPLSKKFSISDFWNDPVVQASYQSGLDLGTKALKNAAPLTTGLDSGAALKELMKFGTDYTGNMAAGSQARFVGDQSNQFNRLAALAGIGQTGVNTSATAGMNASTNASNIIGSNANAQGAAKIAGANAFSGGLTSISNYWQQQQMLNQLKPAGGTTGYTNPPANNWAE